LALTTDPGDALETTFGENRDELILIRDIPLYSVCERLVPWQGSAAVGYPGPSGRITALSKLARPVDLHAKRPQVQERFTSQTADAVQDRLEAVDVIVVVRAEHLCLAMPGTPKPGSVIVASAVRGIFKTDRRTRAETMSLVVGR